MTREAGEAAKIVDDWVRTLSPIDRTVEAFKKGGDGCGVAILRLYRDLIELREFCDEALYGEVDEHGEVA